MDKPVFESGFDKPDESLFGMWTSIPGEGELPQTALLAPLDDKRCLLAYPAGSSGDEMYFEARAITVNKRSLFQLRLLAALPDSLPKPGDPVYTLIWLEKKPEGSVQIRALKGDAVKGKTAAEIQAMLEDSDANWNALFGDPLSFQPGA